MRKHGKREAMTNLFWTAGVTGQGPRSTTVDFETGPQKYRWTTDRKRRTLVIKH